MDVMRLAFERDATLGGITKGIFNRTANRLNLECDVIVVDTSSTHGELDVADEEIELAGAKANEQETETRSEGPAGPCKAAHRQFSKRSNISAMIAISC